MKFNKLKVIPAAVLFSSILIHSQTTEIKDELKKYFDEAGHTGSFVLYDLNNDIYIKYNPDRCRERFIPASTFKIFTSLAALETGAVADESEIIKWDGEKRFYEKWNQDLDMKNAFKYSAVWFYQELAERIGAERMKSFIEKNNYGNEDISGGINRFWLDGGLRISPEEQVNFLLKLYLNELKFSVRTMDKVKEIMIYETAENFVIRAKTGWAVLAGEQIGWFVGYVESGKNVYFFATNIQSAGAEEGFTSRITITRNILKYLGIIF